MNYLNAFINELIAYNAPWGLLLGLCILAIIYLYKRAEDKEKELIKEKDGEIKAKEEILERVTLVLSAVDNTQKAILIDLEREHEKR